MRPEQRTSNQLDFLWNRPNNAAPVFCSSWQQRIEADRDDKNWVYGNSDFLFWKTPSSFSLPILKLRKEFWLPGHNRNGLDFVATTRRNKQNCFLGVLEIFIAVLIQIAENDKKIKTASLGMMQQITIFFFPVVSTHKSAMLDLHCNKRSRACQIFSFLMVVNLKFLRRTIVSYFIVNVTTIQVIYNFKIRFQGVQCFSVFWASTPGNLDITNSYPLSTFGPGYTMGIPASSYIAEVKRGGVSMTCRKESVWKLISALCRPSEALISAPSRLLAGYSPLV